MSENITQQLAALRDKISSIQEDSEFPRMTPEQAEELASDVDQIPTDYVDYDGILYAMNLYAALDDGKYGDHSMEENGDFNNLITDWTDLVEKAAKLQGKEVPEEFGEEGIDIPDDIEREMNTLKAKMKAVFKDPNQTRLQFDSKNNESVDNGDAELAELKASLQRFK